MISTLLPLATGGNQYLTIGLFLLVVALTLYITFWASRSNKTTTDYYAGGRNFSGFQNGLAIGGDYMSAASFLGISGSIALYGYDGFLYSIGFLVAWLVALLLVAELLRNSGRYTMADQLAYRMRQAPVRSVTLSGRKSSNTCMTVDSRWSASRCDIPKSALIVAPRIASTCWVKNASQERE